MKVFTLLAATLFLLLAGCAKSRESMLVGDWTGSGTSLSLKEDKTFSLGLPANGNATGTWALNANNVHLTPKMIGGKTQAEAKKAFEEQIKANPRLKAFAGPIQKLLDGFDLAVTEDNKTMSASFGEGQDLSFTKSEPSK
jgi:hypothetical protein